MKYSLEIQLFSKFEGNCFCLLLFQWNNSIIRDADF